MTIRGDESVIRLEGLCRVEEAETLTVLLQNSPAASVDLSACTGVHAAVLQVMLAFRPVIVGEPEDAVLRHLLPSLAGRQAAPRGVGDAVTVSNMPVQGLKE